MKRFTYWILIALAILAPACMQDSPSPVNDPDIPLVSVDSETLTRVSATLNGSYSKAEGIVAYGFEITSTNFDDKPDRIIEATGVDEEGRFSHAAQVQPGAYYAVRSFISDGHHKKYSTEISLTVPSTSVATPSDVTITGDRLFADIVDDGGRAIREVGFCWSESPDSKTIRLNRMKGEWLDDDTFTAELPRMEEGGTYYFLAYAENASGAQEAFGYSDTPRSYVRTDELFVTIEDDNFFRYLLGRFDKNQDGRLTDKELKVATDITVNTDQIASVQGIEWMPLLSSLDCRGTASGKGRLSTVDVSRNPLLASFYCDNNQIEVLDLSRQPELLAFTCANNQLSALDLSAADKLTRLDCSGNQLAHLDLSACFRLTELNCSNNRLSELDVTRIPYLRQFFFRANPLETIDVSYCTELEKLDGTDCPQLQWVYVSLEQYAVVDTSGNYLIDGTATFYPIFVPIQDDYLYRYLMSVYDEDGDNRISAREAASVTRIEVCSENVRTMSGIEFFYNLEELICGSCNVQIPGQLADLDVSKNRKLTYLDCHGNGITQLDLSNNSLLKHLRCSDNQLKSLDVSGLVLLDYLDCGNNRLASLDVSHCPELEVLDGSSNGLRTLDVSGLTGLTELKCSYNQLSVLDITNNSRLSTVWCEGNQLTYLDVTNNSQLTDVRTDNVYVPDPVLKSYLVSNYDTDGDEEISLAEAWPVIEIKVETKQIYTMEGIQYFVNLEWLICGGGTDESGRQAYGQITSLDLSPFPKLYFLDCRYTQLTALDLSHNPRLDVVTCVGNMIESLDLSNQAELTYLDCALNPLGTLDVSHNPKLNFLHCQYAELTSLDLSNNPALRELYGNNNAFSSLDVTHNPNLERLEFGWSNLVEIDLSKQEKLRSLDARYNNLSALDVSNCPLMNYLDARGNPEFYELTLRTGQEIESLLTDTEQINFIYR